MGSASSLIASKSKHARPELPDQYDKAALETLVADGEMRLATLQNALTFIESSARKLSHQIGDATGRHELAELGALLQDWSAGADGSAARLAAQRHLSSRFLKPRTLFCSDMSGFSRICKEEGILHFLSLVKIMQSLMIPICEAHGGVLIKVAADNLFVLFEDPVSATYAAMDCFTMAHEYSKDRGKNDSIKLSIGLGHGDMWVVDMVDVFGEVANVVYKLGEDIAEKEILVTDSVANQLDTNIFNLEEREVDLEAHGGKMNCFCVTSKNPWPVPPQGPTMPVINPPINAEEPMDFVRLIAIRQAMTTQEERSAVDKRISQKFMARKAVLVIEMHEQADVAATSGVVTYLDYVMRMKRLLQDTVVAWRGKCVRSVENKVIGQVFALFDDEKDAMACALVCRRICVDLPFKIQQGIAVGPLLDLNGCNAFGDAVNMAFKLSEDVATKAGQILFTKEVHASCVQEDGTLNVAGVSVNTSERMEVDISGVTIPHWDIPVVDDLNQAPGSSLMGMQPADAIFTSSHSGVRKSNKRASLMGARV